MGDPNPKRDNGELQDGGEAGPEGPLCARLQGNQSRVEVRGPQGGCFLRVMKWTEYLVHLNVLGGTETLSQGFEVEFTIAHRKSSKHKTVLKSKIIIDSWGEHCPGKKKQSEFTT